MSENTNPADEADRAEDEMAPAESADDAADEIAGEKTEGVLEGNEREGDVLFRQLLEVVLAKMDGGIDDLLAVQDGIQRFGSMATLLIMHMLMDAVRESAPGQTPNMEPLALKWIEDNARSYAEGLMNQDVIAATAKVAGSPELKLHFGRGFRRRILGYN